MNMTRPQGTQPLSFALLGCIPDSSETPLSDTQLDSDRTDLDDRTWNWTEAATEIGINESTLRKIWWEKKLEPAFLHCPQALRVPTRTTASGRQIAEFTAFGIEVLNAYKASVERSDRAAEVFLSNAKQTYPKPAPVTIEPLATALKPDDLPLSPTKVLPPDPEQPCRTTHTTGLSLHLGSSLSLPAIPGIITPGNDTAYLTQAQQRLQQFEALQQQVLSQIQQQQQAAEALNAQYQEATSLSDQLLLQEFQLKGVQLGYTALQLKQQAFKATVQAAEAGTLPVPGKPQSETEPPPSA